jgi:glutamyl-tRNA synthetase
VLHLRQLPAMEDASQPPVPTAPRTVLHETAPVDALARGRRDGRFAPSPTGELHLGNLRTAMLAWLFARHAGARFLVRIDDLDPDRSHEHFAVQQLSDLRAIGLDWDEAPVRQSQRMKTYGAALDRLSAAGYLYRCFCSRAEIREAASAPHGNLPEGAYAGTCAQLSSVESQRRADAGEAHALRVRAEAARITFTDRVHGEVTATVDDFVVRRKDGVPAYNLACIVDDVDQGIGEVVRGDDLVDTTPRQLLLARLLDLAAPTYAHVPLMLGDDGTRLSKRHGSVTMSQLTRDGHSADDVRRMLAASLALPGDTLPELLADFDEARVRR